jgi:hypothetical protein
LNEEKIMGVYRIDLPGSGLGSGYYDAAKGGAARIRAAIDLVDMGHYRTVGDALRAMKCVSVAFAPSDTATTVVRR